MRYWKIILLMLPMPLFISCSFKDGPMPVTADVCQNVEFDFKNNVIYLDAEYTLEAINGKGSIIL